MTCTNIHEANCGCAVVAEVLARQAVYYRSIGKNPDCRCGSGGHPRRCAIHPDRYEAHAMELNADDFDFDGVIVLGRDPGDEDRS